MHTKVIHAGRAPARVLVVDDDEFVREVAVATLESMGFTVVSAPNGQAGLLVLAQAEFDCILVDLEMPVLDGVEFVRQAKQDDRSAFVPCCCISARFDEARLQEFMDAGGEDFMRKPLLYPLLGARIERLIELAQFRRNEASEPERIVSEEGARAAYLCTVCSTAMVEALDSCPTCQQPASADGWATTNSYPDPLLGQTIGNGRYRLLQPLGRGGVGQVFRARDASVQRDIAVKIVVHSETDNRRAKLSRDLFRNEVKSLARIHNPHVVDVRDVVDVDSSTTALIMEFVPGKDLATVIKREGPMEPITALSVIRQVAVGLGDAHRLGVVHADIKPANIIVQRLDGQTHFARILDFGLARIEGEDVHRSGFFYGTQVYCSPEQARCEKVDGRTDVYSLGAVLYYLITGAAPYSGKTATALFTAHNRSPVPQISDERLNVRQREAINALLSTMMAKRPEDRFQTSESLVSALDSARDQLSVGSFVPKEGRRRHPNAPTVRGAAFEAASSYLAESVHPDRRFRIMRQLSEEARDAFRAPRILEHYPAIYFEEWYEAVERELALSIRFDAFVRDLGRFVARQHATLLMRPILSTIDGPQALWERLEQLLTTYLQQADVRVWVDGDGRHICRIGNLSSSRHTALVAIGWLETMFELVSQGSYVATIYAKDTPTEGEIELDVEWHRPAMADGYFRDIPAAFDQVAAEVQAGS